MELAKGGAVAAKSFAILVLVGIVEVIVGTFSASVALIADGAHSFSDAAVSLIVGRLAVVSKSARRQISFWLL
jgi:divalent metal cation (Fe/Co/Zn/Cd) transporter